MCWLIQRIWITCTKPTRILKADLSDFSIHCHAFQMLFVGDVKFQTIKGGRGHRAEAHDLTANYFISNDPARWKGHVGLFHQIDYYNLYNGTDLRFYGDGGKVKV